MEITIGELRKLHESEDHIEFKEAKRNYPFAGGKHTDPGRIRYAGSETDGFSVNYKQKYSAQQQVIKDNYTIFEVPYNGTDNNDYVDGQGFCCDDGSPEAAQARALALENNFQDPDAYEKLQFYYHPDHLGSSSYITNLDGEVVQHIEYVPFGEVFIEERNSIWNTPYLFNAKEFDEETGLYYYGARYYDPRVSLWISTDALQEKYPQHTSYLYVGSNPVNAIDPDGYKIVFINGKIGGGSPKAGAPYWNGYSKGIEKYLKERGRKVEYNVMINTYQVDRINNPKSNETYYVDYQNTNDPVLFV